MTYNEMAWHWLGNKPSLDQGWQTPMTVPGAITGIIPHMGSANERQCYNVILSLNGWAYTLNDPYIHNLGVIL